MVATTRQPGETREGGRHGRVELVPKLLSSTTLSARARNASGSKPPRLLWGESAKASPSERRPSFSCRRSQGRELSMIRSKRGGGGGRGHGRSLGPGCHRGRRRHRQGAEVILPRRLLPACSRRRTRNPVWPRRTSTFGTGRSESRGASGRDRPALPGKQGRSLSRGMQRRPARRPQADCGTRQAEALRN